MWFTLGEGNPSDKEKNNSYAGNTNTYFCQQIKGLGVSALYLV